LVQLAGKANLPQRKQPAERTENLVVGQKIMLSNGLFAMVDLEDFELFSMLKWRARKTNVKAQNTYYAETNIKGMTVSMHKLVANTSYGFDTDHINGNGLDNRRCNLRVVTRSKNLQGFRRKAKGKSSKFRGVCLCSETKRWIASIKNPKDKWTRKIGRYDTELEAAKAYDKKAIELGFFKEALNFNRPE